MVKKTSSHSSKFCLLLWRVEGFEGFKGFEGFDDFEGKIFQNYYIHLCQCLCTSPLHTTFLDASASHWLAHPLPLRQCLRTGPFQILYLDASAYALAPSISSIITYLDASACALAPSISSILTPVLRTGCKPHPISKLFELLNSLKALKFLMALKSKNEQKYQKVVILTRLQKSQN